MDFAGESQIEVSVDTLIDWWDLAGVTQAVSEIPVNWLQPPRPAAISDMPVERAVQLPTASWPDTLEAFQGWLATDMGLLEMSWPQLSSRTRRAVPTGEAAPTLMVISDMPDPEDNEAGTLLNGEAGRLFDAMMAAVGLKRSDIYLSSLAVLRPAGGIFSDSDAAQLADRMRHHIALVGPRRLLLLGDKTKHALLQTVDAGNAIGLRPLNHKGGSVDSIATLHPRLLLKQPAAKMGCWRQLQLLIEALPA
ncbi:uracil-DNA glycosylase [Sphingobium sp. SCG-1]|uniref:uracil-DNA glycosylase family protein n=1 Tax=Sphingobium sp. SCG-1 TaxID=2072936 RepID=UPI000CD6C2F8|nr:uracil-DNA glycosylase family protein [Sphingobium sp. SCG-1]AUW58536.1 uracil-DNA glycosylase [Sphingobium sp. SCG-1]